MNDAHLSDAQALIRLAAREDRELDERRLRAMVRARTCQFLAKHTGLPLADVIAIYEEAPQ
jgi:hypothetical protein